MLIRALVNALVIQKSFYNRVDVSKPNQCRAIDRCMEHPWLFSDKQMCPDCTCKYSCRYDSFGPPSYLIIKNSTYPSLLVTSPMLYSQKGPTFGNTSWFSIHPRKDSSSL